MALRISGSGPLAAQLAESGVETMAERKQAPGNGIVRSTAGQARRIRKGGLIPVGWRFEADGAPTETAPETAEPKKRAARGPKEDTKSAGPSETAESGKDGEAETPPAETDTTNEPPAETAPNPPAETPPA